MAIILGRTSWSVCCCTLFKIVLCSWQFILHQAMEWNLENGHLHFFQVDAMYWLGWLRQVLMTIKKE